MADLTRWNFWLVDDDRSTGWTNHGYVLQYVCCGYGDTPEQAWQWVIKHQDHEDGTGVPDGFHLPEDLTAIREDEEHRISVEEFRDKEIING